MMVRRLAKLLFNKQPIERGDDELSNSIRQDIHHMKRTLSKVEQTMDELLAQRALSGKDRNEHR